MKSDFSEAEIRLFETLGLSDCLDLDPLPAYRVAATTAFAKNLQGKPIDALRKGFAAFSLGTPCRKTPEWDEMISFPEVDDSIREMSDIVDRIKDNLISYKNPGSYQEDSWYIRCEAKADALEEVLSLLGKF